MFLCLCSHVGRASPNTSPAEWMSVSVSRLEAGRPSCDSMWLAGASRSLAVSHSLSRRRCRARGAREETGTSKNGDAAQSECHFIAANQHFDIHRRGLKEAKPVVRTHLKCFLMSKERLRVLMAHINRRHTPLTKWSSVGTNRQGCDSSAQERSCRTFMDFSEGV